MIDQEGCENSGRDALHRLSLSFSLVFSHLPSRLISPPAGLPSVVFPPPFHSLQAHTCVQPGFLVFPPLLCLPSYLTETRPLLLWRKTEGFVQEPGRGSRGRVLWITGQHVTGVIEVMSWSGWSGGEAHLSLLWLGPASRVQVTTCVPNNQNDLLRL